MLRVPPGVTAPPVTSAGGAIVKRPPGQRAGRAARLDEEKPTQNAAANTSRDAILTVTREYHVKSVGAKEAS